MKKRHYQIARENWRMIVGNRLLWVFGLFASAYSMYPTSALQSDNLGLECLVQIGSLFLLALGAIGTVGLIHIADNIPLEPTLSFADVWRRSVRFYIRVIVMNLILGLALLIPFSCLVCSILGREANAYSAFFIFGWVISPITLVIGTLAACGIVITELPISDSLKKGVRIFGRHVAEMLLLGVTYVAVPAIVTIGGFFALRIIHFDMNLPSPIPITGQTYSELLRIPAIITIRSITYFIIVPLWTILIALAYKEYSGKTAPSTRTITSEGRPAPIETEEKGANPLIDGIEHATGYDWQAATETHRIELCEWMDSNQRAAMGSSAGWRSLHDGLNEFYGSGDPALLDQTILEMAAVLSILPGE